MTQLILQAIAFVLFLIALPLLSFGTMQETEPLWIAGLVLIAVAGLIPPILRFAPIGDDDGGDGDGARRQQSEESQRTDDTRQEVD